MSADALPWATFALSVLTFWAGFRWSRRADRRAETANALDVRTTAVADLAEGLHLVRRLARQADVAPVTKQQVIEVMVDFEDRSHRHQAVLPVHLRPVDREVRAAMGNAFGPPAWAGLDARLADHALAPFDHHWWDITRSYLEHVDACLQDWRTSPRRSQPIELVNFYAWRQIEDAEYFASLEPQIDHITAGAPGAPPRQDLGRVAVVVPFG